MFLESEEVKNGFARVLEQASSLASLKAYRDRVVAEMNRLPENRDRIELAGKTIGGEKRRLDAELEKITTQEREVRQKVQAFFGSLNQELIQTAQKRIPEFLTKRLRIGKLLIEAAGICEELEQASASWDREVQELKKKIARVVEETAERYALPESPLPSPFVPVASRTAIETGRTSFILKAIGKQIS